MEGTQPKRSFDYASLEQAARSLDSDHWLASYINDLLNAHRLGNGLDFATAEMLLAQEKQTFEKELAIARKVYRLYPYLVDAAEPRAVASEYAATRSGQ